MLIFQHISPRRAALSSSAATDTDLRDRAPTDTAIAIEANPHDPARRADSKRFEITRDAPATWITGLLLRMPTALPVVFES